ncbi:Transposase [Oopsacas minuta]|uniref:Transposase n=1 Tax=Oopsacas minuta TaxID=111878 RepID=A0AAV7K473_9METZ|nr:Transposase [Oopsacas minuta]
MFYNYKRGINAMEYITEMFSVFREQSPTKTSIYKWYSRLSLSYMCLDDVRTGRPIMAATNENITKVEELVREDRQIAIRQLVHDASVSSETIETILHQHLGKKGLFQYSKADFWWHSEVITGDETWVYFYDMPPKQQISKWIFEDEVPDTIPKRFMAVGKRIFAIFFTTRELLEFVILPAKHTVTAAWYTECYLPKLFNSGDIETKVWIRGMKLHHDNAPAYTARRTKEFVRQ